MAHLVALAVSTVEGNTTGATGRSCHRLEGQPGTDRGAAAVTLAVTESGRRKGLWPDGTAGDHLRLSLAQQLR